MQNKITHNGIDNTFLTIYSVILGLYFSWINTSIKEIDFLKFCEFGTFVLLLVAASIVMPAIRLVSETKDLNDVKIELLILVSAIAFIAVLESRYALNVNLKSFLDFYSSLLVFWLIFTCIFAFVNWMGAKK